MSIEEALKNLNHTNEQVREMAAQFLRAAGAEGRQALRAALRGGHLRLSLNAAYALADCADEQSLETLAEAVILCSPLGAEAAVKALTDCGETAVPFLLNTLPECRPLAQLAIVDALERVGSPTAVAPLMELLARTEYPSLRYTIIQTLGMLRAEAAVDLIRTFADDPDHHVRERVQIALERLDKPAANAPP